MFRQEKLCLWDYLSAEKKKWFYNKSLAILETHYPSSEINIAYAQVVEIKDLEPIRDIRLLENKVGQIKLTEEALNEIRMNMGMIYLSLRCVGEPTYDDRGQL